MSTQLFKFESTDGAKVIELSLPQVLDSSDFDQLNDAMANLLRQGANGKWVLDLAQTVYLGSAMLGLMVNLRQQIRTAGGTLVLCSVPNSLMQIFRTCCMERLFVIKKTRDDALNH